MISICFLVLISLHHFPLLVFSSSYNATDSILFNCGSNQTALSPDNQTWSADFRSKFGPVVDNSDHNNKLPIATQAIKQGPSTPFVPYMTARISRSKFTYNFPVTSGQKFVRFYFYPTNYPGGFERNKDRFDVRVGAYTFLHNFSASLYADDWDTETFSRELSVNVAEQEQSLNITFTPFLGDSSNDSYAFINGIEILSMPPNLYHTPPEDDQGVKFIGENTTTFSRVQNNTALETVCRLNIGGNFINPEDDTGFYRYWKDDTPYRDSLGAVFSRTSTILNYSKIQQFVAPRDVYISNIYMGGITDNLTWGVPVYPGCTYLFRLHFCEFFDSVAVNDRRFDIFIDNKTAEIGVDIVELTGGSFIPIYKDYLVTAGEKGKTQDYTVNVTIRPNPKSLYPEGFLNGMEVLRLNDSNGNLYGPNPKPTLSPAEPATEPVQPLPKTNKGNNKTTLLVVAIGGSVIGLLIILFVTCLVVFWRLKKNGNNKHASYSRLFSCCGRLSSRKGHSVRSKASSLPQELCRNFSLDEIIAATNNFDESLIIGKGGFGNVYKGIIDDGTTLVAIKKLNHDSKQGGKEFKTEIEMLSQLRHVHLVPLIGYCTDEGEMILVYDYMTNGTLREHLYDNTNDPLSWKQRLEICIGAARGFDYLHTGAAHTIIHRDIKTTNILLDEHLIAKVSDFGLSRICVTNTAVSTMVKGTFGYLDPEYARCHQLTEKSDVYSFGVVLFEVLCARKALNNKLDQEQWNLAIWARKCIKNETIYEIIDPFLMGKISPECFNKFVEIAESCIRDNGSERPSMHDVKEKLEFALELQKAADAEKKGIDDPVYPEVSFCAPKYTNFGVGSSDSSRVEASDVSMTCTNSEFGNTTSSYSAFCSDASKSAPT